MINERATPLNLYHGSPKRPQSKTFGCPGNRVPQISSDRPFFFTNDLPYAVRFARGGIVSVVRLTADSVLDLHNEQALMRLLAIYNRDLQILERSGQWDEEIEGDIAESGYRLLDSPDVMNTLQKEGVQAVFLAEDHDLRVTSFAIIDPRCVEFSHIVRGLGNDEIEPNNGPC